MELFITVKGSGFRAKLCAGIRSKSQPVQGVTALFRCIRCISNYNPKSGKILALLFCPYSPDFLDLQTKRAFFCDKVRAV